MKEVFLKWIWDNFLKVQSAVGSMFAVFFWIYPPSANISIKLALPMAIISISLIIALFNLTYKCFRIIDKLGINEEIINKVEKNNLRVKKII